MHRLITNEKSKKWSRAGVRAGLCTCILRFLQERQVTARIKNVQATKERKCENNTKTKERKETNGSEKAAARIPLAFLYK